MARRHAEYYLSLVQGASSGLRSAARRPWIELLEREHDNCRAALAWSLSPAGDLSLGQSLVERLSWFWEIAGHHDEGREWMSRFVAAGRGGRTPLHARLMGIAGAFVWLSGDLLTAEKLAREGVTLARELGDEESLAACLTYLGLPLLMLGNPGAARDAYQESIELLQSTGNRWFEALTLNWLADSLWACGDQEAARLRYEESLARWREVDDPWGVAIPSCNLGWVAARDGDWERAQALMAESTRLFRELGDRYGQAWAQSALGLVRLRAGLLEEAERDLREALFLAAQLRNPTALVESVAGMAGVFAGRDPAMAARLLGAADKLMEQFPLGLWYAKMGLDQVAELVTSLGEPEVVTRERAAGHELTPEQAVQLALAAAAGAGSPGVAGTP
jgi:tetratricopeptide (TPR) repeat protein